MDPPPEGCPLCGSTWGDWWAEVDGKLQFFCCELCGQQWEALLTEVKNRTGWEHVDKVDVQGNRWGRTCLAAYRGGLYRFFIAFTPEGALRKFEELPIESAPAPVAPALEPVVPEPTPEGSPVPASEPEVSLGDEPPPEPAGTETMEPAVLAGELTLAGLHPLLKDRLADEGTRFPDLTKLDPAEGRRIARQMYVETDNLAGAEAAVAMLKTTSVGLTDHRVPVRVYVPTEGDAPYPAVVYLHGGGWVFGDLDTHDSVCREVANRSHCIVVSVQYRRAPEHRFPAPVDDAYGVVQWVADPSVAARLQVDPAKIAVAGDSVGGNLAAVVCQVARERGGPMIGAQVLICPVTDYLPQNDSMREYASGFGLDATFMPWMWQQYLRTPADAREARAVPLRATDLSGLPPALVITAECDILRDEGEEYGSRLAEAGVDAQVTRYPGMIHGFIDYRGIVGEGWDALDEIGNRLRTLFGR
jgi:acetyl esterase